jgi:hypothetical protein
MRERRSQIDSCFAINPVHVVCAPKEDSLAVITAYIPNPEEWDGSFKRGKNYEMFFLEKRLDL